MVTFLSKEQIAQAAPSVLAKSHDGLRSDRYTFVDTEQVIDYFRRYLGKFNIEIYWGSAQQFMTELHTRWQERQHG